MKLIFKSAKVLAGLFFILSIKSFAHEAVCIVLEAPMLLKPDMKSIVSQFIRKGQKIKVRDRNVGISSMEVSYDPASEQAYFPQDSKGNEYFESVDSAGRTVYIPKKYMKVIFRDEREESLAIEKDPTDYRIYEPISDEYPFYRYNKRKLFWSYGLGSTQQTNYRYPRKILNESISSRSQLDAAFFKKVKDDPLDRFYFGGYLHLYGDESKYELEDEVESTELRGQFGIGPSLLYEFFRRESLAMTFWGAITVNYDRLFVSQSQGQINEERIFHGFSVTPKFGTLLQFKNIIPFGDITLGMQMQLNYKYQLTTSSEIQIEEFWNFDQDTYNYPFGGIYTIYLGTLTSI